MSWQDEVTELEQRRTRALGMGGKENIQRHHDRGKLTARERIDRIADPDSFREARMLVGESQYTDGQLQSFLPKGSVEGTVKIDGRKVVVVAGDFTVRGGSGGGTNRGSLGAEPYATQRAIEWRLPYVRLLDAAGGSVRGFETLGRTYLPDGNSYGR